jgi:NAD(P)-dependent dehydrogenase (short-subunit alcohol dehydrogenase family)
MDRFLNGKYAIVTGGTKGIGRAIAEALLESGASVAICGRSQNGVDEAVNALRPRGNVVGRAVDVGKPDQVSKFFRDIDECFERLDILINNAGLGVFKSVAEMTVDDWKLTIDTNLSGVFYCSHEALPRFKRTGRGYIIDISSLAGRNPFAGGAAYNASKFGLNGFSEAMMLDHRNDNVRVSYVMPGSVNTEFNSGGGADWKIDPRDVADVVMMLLRMPERTLVSRVEMRPSRPKK